MPKISPASDQARGLCGPGAMGFLRLVSVNVANYCVSPVKALKIKRAFGLNGLFSVPVFRLWQH